MTYRRFSGSTRDCACARPVLGYVSPTWPLVVSASGQQRLSAVVIIIIGFAFFTSTSTAVGRARRRSAWPMSSGGMYATGWTLTARSRCGTAAIGALDPIRMQFVFRKVLTEFGPTKKLDASCLVSPSALRGKNTSCSAERFSLRSWLEAKNGGSPRGARRFKAAGGLGGLLVRAGRPPPFKMSERTANGP